MFETLGDYKLQGTPDMKHDTNIFCLCFALFFQVQLILGSALMTTYIIHLNYVICA